MNSYRKVKTVAKNIMVKGETLDEVVLSTMKTISNIVGSTLGPGGCPILIERQEYGLPNIITKDGVTTFRFLGFTDPTAHCIMETARDTATRTVAEAGDGTTSSTVLAEAIVRYTNEFCKRYTRMPPQRVIRRLEFLFKNYIEHKIKEWSIIPDATMLKAVANISTNGDTPLAEAVMECFDLVGSDGNITLIEENGPSQYRVESLKGYPINIGYEESCRSFLVHFLNDPANNRCFMENPVFVLYHGEITEIQTVVLLLEKIGQAWEKPQSMGLERAFNHNVVIVATNFSDAVLGTLANNFRHAASINVFPLQIPKFPTQNGQLHFLYDLASVVGAKVFDRLSNPLSDAELTDLIYGNGVESIEINRYRTTILGLADENLVIARAEEVKRGLANSESKFDTIHMQDRVARLTGGVAKLIVVGASSGELREKRDRAEDATYAVRGAQKHGCLPGGCWTFVQLNNFFKNEEATKNDPVVKEVLIPALNAPLIRLLSNTGMTQDEISDIIHLLSNHTSDERIVYDAMENVFKDAVAGGLLDSVPAVLEAIRSSFSIATLLGTIGGSIVFQRDTELERNEAVSVSEFLRATGENNLGAN